jgi:ribosomal protection tetracycline resistance protein
VATLLFVNKIDRGGADADRTLRAVEERLTPAVVPMGSVDGAATRAAAFVPFGPPDGALAEQSRAGRLHPVFFGSRPAPASRSWLRGSPSSCLPLPATTTRPSPGGSSRSSAARAATGSPTSGCSPAPCAPATGSRQAR